MLPYRGVSNCQTNAAQTFSFEKVGILCFWLFGVTDIHMWQKGLGRFWWTLEGRIEWVKSAMGTQALDLKSFQLGPCDQKNVGRLT